MEEPPKAAIGIEESGDGRNRKPEHKKELGES